MALMGCMSCSRGLASRAWRPAMGLGVCSSPQGYESGESWTGREGRISSRKRQEGTSPVPELIGGGCQAASEKRERQAGGQGQGAPWQDKLTPQKQRKTEQLGELETEPAPS